MKGQETGGCGRIWRGPLLALLLWLFPSPVVVAEGLALAVEPYLPIPELEARFGPLVEHISAQLGQPVALRIARSHEQHLNWVGRNRVDIAFMTPTSYIELINRYGLRPLLGRMEMAGQPSFVGTIFVRSDSPLRRLQDLQGQLFAFGDRHSTMSYIVPREVLSRAGVELDDLAGYRMLGNPYNVALAVLAGNYQAGAVRADIFALYEARGLRPLASSPRVSAQVFLVRPGLAPELEQRLRALLLAMRDTPEGQQALQAIKPDITGIVPASDCNYDSLRELLTQQGIGDLEIGP